MVGFINANRISPQKGIRPEMNFACEAFRQMKASHAEGVGALRRRGTKRWEEREAAMAPAEIVLAARCVQRIQP